MQSSSTSYEYPDVFGSIEDEPKGNCAVYGCLRPRWRHGYCGTHFADIHIYDDDTVENQTSGYSHIANADRNIQLIGRIGRGDVYIGKLYGQDVSIRVMKDIESNAAMGFDSLHMRIETLKTLRHPSIVQFMDVVWVSQLGAVCLIEELLPNGAVDELLSDLDSFYDEQKDQGTIQVPRRLQQWTCKRFLVAARDILSGISWLHHRKLYHHNLKSSNALLTAQFNIKIADYKGLQLNDTLHASSQDDTARSAAQQGVPTPLPDSFFQAPEMAQKGIEAGPKADIYSFGFLLYEMISFCNPRSMLEFRRVTAVPERLDKALKRGWRPPIPVHCIPKQLNALPELIEQCWDPNPDQRPIVDRILVKLRVMEIAVDNALHEVLSDRMKQWDLPEHVDEMLQNQVEQIAQLTGTLDDAKGLLSQSMQESKALRSNVDAEVKAVKVLTKTCAQMEEKNGRLKQRIASMQAEVEALDANPDHPWSHFGSVDATSLRVEHHRKPLLDEIRNQHSLAQKSSTLPLRRRSSLPSLHGVFSRSHV